jgi:hypothetical protein
MCCASCTDFSSTVYAFVASEELLQSTTIYPSWKPCFILFCQLINPQVLGNFCDLVGSSPPRIQCGAMRLLYLGFVYESQVYNLEIINLDIGCLVEVMFDGISQLH